MESQHSTPDASTTPSQSRGHLSTTTGSLSQSKQSDSDDSGNIQTRLVDDYDDDDVEGMSGYVGQEPKNYTKLQVLTAKHIQRLTFFSHCVTAIALTYTIAFLILQNTRFKTAIQVPKTPEVVLRREHNVTILYPSSLDENFITMSIPQFRGRGYFGFQGYASLEDISGNPNFFDVNISYPPIGFAFTCIVTRLVLGIMIFFIFIIYSQRIIRYQRSDTTHEQTWIILLLFAGFLWFNIPGAILRLLALRDPLAAQIHILDKIHRLLQPVQNGAFQVASLFYIWSSSQTYRILDPQDKLRFPTFYLPKIVILGILLAAKVVAFFKYKMYLSPLPLISMITMIQVFHRYSLWSQFKREVIYLTAVTILEFGIVAYIVADIIRTYRFLSISDYMKYRNKQVGFRFFAFHNLTFYLLFLSTVCLLTLAKPAGEYFILLVVLEEHYFDGSFWDHISGAQLLFFCYIIIEAYVNLPADSIGFIKGWFVPSKVDASSNTAFRNPFRTSITTQGRPISSYVSLHGQEELSHPIVEPVTYRRREGRDFFELQANCFVMETHLALFNYAWLVYWRPTSFRFKEKQQSLNIVDFTYIECEETDTCALIVSFSDRIVVSFKGTTSMKNLRTNCDVYFEKLDSVVTTTLESNDEMYAHLGRDWERARVHRGFANAYKSVQTRVINTIRSVLDQKHRPICITGHSLGGALSSLCSLDCWFSLPITRREVRVTTFGAPKVGNKHFSRLCDLVVPMSWRIVVESDIVTKLPLGYSWQPTGKLVQLFPEGEMFIDPNALEHKLWSGKAAGFAYHRKASYLLCLWAWAAKKHHGPRKFMPELWKWPITAEDMRRFKPAFKRFGREHAWSLTSQSISERSESIAVRNALVDALEDEKIPTGASALDRWAKLVQKTLLHHCVDLVELG